MENKLAKLELIWRLRAGGGGRTERRFIDFVVDGQSLFALINADYIGLLGWCAPEFDEDTINGLLLKRPADLISGRHLFYVCPECGDIECGAVTGSIEKTATHFVWQEFGFESGINSEAPQLAGYEHIGPFYFHKSDYWQVLTDYLKSLRG